MVAPTLTLAQTDGITYSVDTERRMRRVQTVVVTATLEEPGWRGPIVAGGVDGRGPTTATWTVLFADAACNPVSPANPTVVQATCVNGVVTVPTVTAGSGPAGVSYRLAPAGPL